MHLGLPTTECENTGGKKYGHAWYTKSVQRDTLKASTGVGMVYPPQSPANKVTKGSDLGSDISRVLAETEFGKI